MVAGGGKRDLGKLHKAISRKMASTRAVQGCQLQGDKVVLHWNRIATYNSVKQWFHSIEEQLQLALRVKPIPGSQAVQEGPPLRAAQVQGVSPKSPSAATTLYPTEPGTADLVPVEKSQGGLQPAEPKTKSQRVSHSVPAQQGASPQSLSAPSGQVLEMPPPAPAHLTQKAIRAFMSQVVPVGQTDVDEMRRRLSEEAPILGEGTFGITRRINHPEMGWVVIKSAKYAHRMLFLKEVDMLSRFRHPNVIRALDIDCSWPWSITMPDCGRPLRAYLNDQPAGCPSPAWQRTAKQLLDGLAHMHSLNIVHCDIKPENIVILPTGQITIIDVGCSFFDRPGSRPGATPQEHSAAAIRVDGLPYGTLYYRSPELFLGNQSFGWPIDIWAAGCVLWELMAGHIMFYVDKSKTPMKVMMHVILKRLGHPSKEALAFFALCPNWSFGICSVGQGELGDFAQQLQAGRANRVTLAEGAWLQKMMQYLPLRRSAAQHAAVAIRRLSLSLPGSGSSNASPPPQV